MNEPVREYTYTCEKENASLCSLRTWVDSEHGQFSSLFSQHVHPKLVDARTLSGSRHTADADAHRVAGVGQALLYHLLCQDLMVGVYALNQRHGLTQHRDITLQDAFHIFPRREQLVALLAHTAQVGIHDGRLGNARIHLQSCIFRTVFWMFHTNIFQPFPNLPSRRGGMPFGRPAILTFDF